jgi:hypothetical protein
MTVGRHFDVKLLARDLLIIEPEAARQPRELGLVRRLLEKDEDEEGEEPQRDCKADESANDGESLKEHDEQRSANRVERQMLPLWEYRMHWQGMWRRFSRWPRGSFGTACRCFVTND